MAHSYAHLYRHAGRRVCVSLRFMGRGDGPDMAMWLFAEAILAGTPDQAVQSTAICAAISLT